MLGNPRAFQDLLKLQGRSVAPPVWRVSFLAASVGSCVAYFIFLKLIGNNRHTKFSPHPYRRTPPKSDRNQTVWVEQGETAVIYVTCLVQAAI